MERAELRAEINRVLLIVAVVAVLGGLAWALFNQMRNEAIRKEEIMNRAEETRREPQELDARTGGPLGLR